MALLDPKNLVSPFTNKVHLLSIILGALLFVIFRFSHGGFSANSRSSAAPQRQPTDIRAPQVDPRGAPLRKTESPAAEAKPRWELELDLPKAAATKAQKPSPALPESGGGLEAIERELGLR